ncbi:hypothetical protein PYW07_002410 [Mythimna separata]|uniref:Uncharacterized protein n=1 Tax=Mythimna separata TaxID=271217 RepID=A0AAD7YNB2_MYTSE|nr:hypothetical protein PYW07_002410 [Mythimna separata]
MAHYSVGGVATRSPPSTPSLRPPTPSKLLLLRQSPAPAAPLAPAEDQLPPMTPRDQLTNFVYLLAACHGVRDNGGFRHLAGTKQSVNRIATT